MLPLLDDARSQVLGAYWAVFGENMGPCWKKTRVVQIVFHCACGTIAALLWCLKDFGAQTNAVCARGVKLRTTRVSSTKRIMRTARG